MVLRRPNRVCRLKDTRSIECFCIYKYQLVTHVDRQQDSCFHPFYVHLFVARISNQWNSGHTFMGPFQGQMLFPLLAVILNSLCVAGDQPPINGCESGRILNKFQFQFSSSQLFKNSTL